MQLRACYSTWQREPHVHMCASRSVPSQGTWHRCPYAVHSLIVKSVVNPV